MANRDRDRYDYWGDEGRYGRDYGRQDFDQGDEFRRGRWQGSSRWDYGPGNYGYDRDFDYGTMGTGRRDYGWQGQSRGDYGRGNYGYDRDFDYGATGAGRRDYGWQGQSRGDYGRGNYGYDRDFDYGGRGQQRGDFGRSNYGQGYDRESFDYDRRDFDRGDFDYGYGGRSNMGRSNRGRQGFTGGGPGRSDYGFNRDYDYGSGYDRDFTRSGYNQGYDYDYGQTNFGFEPSWTYTEFWLIPGPMSGKGPRSYQRSDDRICEDVSDRLTQHGRLDASDIDIEVDKGEITLKGTVDSRRDKRVAEDIAESVSGVHDVHNQLRVKQQAQQSQQSGQQNQQSGLQGQQQGMQGTQTQQGQQNPMTRR